MGKEFEFKYLASASELDAVRAAFPGQYQTISMETTYYDTRDAALSARKWTLRRRLENGISVCTIKTPATTRARGEWECACERIEDAVSELCKLGCPQDLALLVQPGLIPVCGAQFTRQTQLLTLPGCTAELALDQGFLFAGQHRVPFSETELELKSGSEEALLDFAGDFSVRFQLSEEPKSKFQRALALAEGE